MTAPVAALSTSSGNDSQTGRIQRWSIAVADRIGTFTLPQLTAIIWISSLVMCLALLGSSRDSIRGTMNIVENWGAVERVALWQDWLEPVIPRFQLPTGVIAWGFRTAMAAGFVAQVAAFVVVMRSDTPSLWKWMIGPLGAHLIMLVLMVPSNSDVFFYEAIGHFAANGMNPYVHELMDWPDHPLVPFNYWIDINVPYGPLWVNYNRIVMGIVGPDPVIATLVQKVLAGLVTFALVGFVFWFARKLSGSRRLATAAAVLVAWQPNMIFETTGQVHNDPHVVLIATAGLAMAVLGGLAGLRGGILAVAVSASTKFVTVPLFGVLGIIRIVERKKPNAVRRIFGNWIIDGIGILAILVAAFAPYWVGPETLDEMVQEPNKLYTQPVWRLIQSVIRISLSEGAANTWTTVSRTVLQITTVSLLIGTVVWLGVRLWRSPHLSTEPDEDPVDGMRLPWWTRPVLYAWMFMFLVVAYLPVNSHPWYWVWPVVAVSLVIAFDAGHSTHAWSIRLLPTWFWVYLWGHALLTLMYHTRIARY